MSSQPTDRKRSKKRSRSEIGRGAAEAGAMDETGSGGGVCAPETGRRSGTSRRHKPKTRVRGAVQTTFASLQPQLLPSTLEVVASLGFTTLTPVQAATIPLFLTNKDVAVEAVTGSGKTVAFVIPVVEMLQRDSVSLRTGDVGCVILSPTRELARQIYEVTTLFTNNTDTLSTVLLVGGTDVAADLERCARGCSIIIGTPGRVHDILRRQDGPPTKNLEVLVLDEADTLLDLGFHDTINQILSFLPKQRRTGLFSATQTNEVQELARAGLRNPVVVSVKVKSTASQIIQKTPTSLDNFYVMCSSDQKLSQLVHFLKKNPDAKIIVFFITCACVDFFVKVLEICGVSTAERPVWGLHGRMQQKKRVGTHNKFKQCKQGVLLCTDVAARGIDIPDIDWIVQFDPPQDPNFFVHRVGRTARAGKRGKALVYLLPAEDTYVHFLGLHEVPIHQQEPVAGVDDVLPLVQAAALEDRDVLEKGTRAFVSFIRGYKEHKCRFIFRYSALDIGAVARAFALVKLPRMTEFRGVKIDFTPVDVDTGAIKFRDRHREKQRQRRLKRDQEAMEAKAAARRVQAEKRRRQAAKPEPIRKRKHKSKHAEIMAEWAELAKEEQLARRMRKGKMTEAEFDKQAYGEDEDIEMLLEFDRQKEREAAEAERAAAEEAARAAMEAASGGAKRKRRAAAPEADEPVTKAVEAGGSAESVDVSGPVERGVSNGAGVGSAGPAEARADAPQRKRKRKRRRKKKADASAVATAAVASTSGTSGSGAMAGGAAAPTAGARASKHQQAASATNKSGARDPVPKTVWARFSRPAPQPRA